MNRAALGRVAAYAAVVVVGAGGLWRVETTARTAQDAAEAVEAERLAAAERSCEDAAETRRILRQMTREGGVASGVTSGEALILAVGAEADPAVVDLYRRHLTSLLDPALVDIVNELPDRRWDPEAEVCVDVPVGTS